MMVMQKERANITTPARSASFHAVSAASNSGESTPDGFDIHDLPWRPYEPSRNPPVVMLLLDDRSASRAALQWGQEAAKALGAELSFVFAIPSPPYIGRSPLTPSLLARLRGMSPTGHFDVELHRGNLRQVGIEMARTKSPALVVVGSTAGTEACSLVDELHVPVLVARDAPTGGPILAASDMEHLEYPVLATAREYAQALERKITFFHNAHLPSFSTSETMASFDYASTFALQEQVVEAKSACLRKLAGDAPNVDTFVARAPRTVNAILELARQSDADIVSVGHQRRSRLGRLLGQRVAERLVRRCKRSVLVVPLA